MIYVNIYVDLRKNKKTLCKWSWVTSADLKEATQTILTTLQELPICSRESRKFRNRAEACDPVGLVDLLVVMRIQWWTSLASSKKASSNIFQWKTTSKASFAKDLFADLYTFFFLVAMPHDAPYVFRLIDLSQSPRRGWVFRCSQGESCCKMMTSGRSGTRLFWAWKAAEAGVWQNGRGTVFRAWVKQTWASFA